jgi:DNA modification methylase
MVICGDSAEELKRLPDNCIDLIVTDCPYGISLMGKDWDKALPSLEILKECCRVLKSGAFAFVMSSPRQDVLSRMIIKLEDAGFVTGFTSIYWAYASGMPKAQNIEKMISKKFGEERAKEFDGAYAGLNLKPAVEVIISAIKPLSERTYMAQAMSNKKGILWLDDCRIPFANQSDVEVTERKNAFGEFDSGSRCSDNMTFKDNSLRGKYGNYDASKGRFPGNLLVSDDVLQDGIERKSIQSKSYHKAYGGREDQADFLRGYSYPGNQYSDSGSFSRFFDLDAWWAKKVKELPLEVQKTFPYLIVTKPRKKERNKGCEDIGGNDHVTVKPIKLFSYLITLGSRKNDIILDPFCGSGTCGIAAKLLNRQCLLIDIDPRNREIAEARINAWGVVR